jgi:hypothetical protein
MIHVRYRIASREKIRSASRRNQASGKVLPSLAMPGAIMKFEIDRPVGHPYTAQRPTGYVAEISQPTQLR